MSAVNEPSGPRLRVMWISTIAFTVMFIVWLMLGVLGIPIRNELQLTDSQLEWLIATAILSGSLLRLHFGIWADRYGGRNVMIALLLLCAIPTYIFSQAHSYEALLVCVFLRPGGEFVHGGHFLELCLVSAPTKRDRPWRVWGR